MPNPKKKIAIVRAIDLRLVQAEHASCFTKLKPIYVANYNPEISFYSQKVGLKYISLPLTPSLYFDPASIIFDKPVNKSWLYFQRDRFEKVLKNIDYYQIQEPYFIYSGQTADVSKKFNRPLICAPWTSFLHPSTYIPPYSFSVRKTIRQTSLFIVRSKKAEKDYLSHFKIPDHKKVLIYHGINLKRYLPAKTKESDHVKILFAGQLTKHKGIDDLLAIFPKLVKNSKKAIELIICGGGEYEKKIRQMSQILPISFLGQVSSIDMPSVYRCCDIFCGPSKDWYSFGIKRTEEGFGLVFLEAMASGLPVVANDCGAIKEAVGDDNYLNKQGDQKALYSSLFELINNKKIGLEIGLKNRKRVEKLFDIKKQVSLEEQAILKLESSRI